jgi:hypothetical protein
MQNLKAAILEYWQLGFKALPCRITYQHGKKLPYFGNGYGWKEECSQAQALARLEGLGSFANGLIIITGPESGILVLDVDSGNGKQGSAALARFGLCFNPDTVQARTQGGGSHYYFRFPEGMEHSTGADVLGPGSGVDLRGAGGYVYAPPSQVHGGGGYSWIVAPGQGVLRLPPRSLMSLLEARRQRAPQGTYTAGNKGLDALFPKQREILLEKIGRCQGAEIGQRSGFDFAVCVWGLKIGLARQALWELLAGVGKFAERGEPYFDMTFNRAFAALTGAPR